MDRLSRKLDNPIPMLLAWTEIRKILHLQSRSKKLFLKALLNALLLNKIQLELQQDFHAEEKYHFVLPLQHFSVGLQIKLEQLVLEEILLKWQDLILVAAQAKMDQVKWLFKTQDFSETYQMDQFYFQAMEFQHRKVFNQLEIITMVPLLFEQIDLMRQYFIKMASISNQENVNYF